MIISAILLLYKSSTNSSMCLLLIVVNSSLFIIFKDTIKKTVPVTVGQPITIPCYERVQRCSVDPVSFKWLKDNTNIYQIEKGGLKKNGRADVSPDGIEYGNFSLVFHKAYFSDRGTYKCNDKEEIVLNLNSKSSKLSTMQLLHQEVVLPQPENMLVCVSKGMSVQ